MNTKTYVHVVAMCRVLKCHHRDNNSNATVYTYTLFHHTHQHEKRGQKTKRREKLHIKHLILQVVKTTLWLHLPTGTV